MALDFIRTVAGRVGVLEPIRRVRRGRRLRSRRRLQGSRYPEVDREDLPILLGNAMAKSGSHILSQFLMGLESLTPLVFTNWEPLRTLDRAGGKKDTRSVTSQLEQLVPGDIVWGYLPADEPFLRWFRQQEARSFFVFRDPRDKIISHILYAMEIHEGHAMRDYYLAIESMEERIHHTIVGVPGLVEPIRATYESYWDWLTEPGVMALRYEDLVDSRDETLAGMLDFLETSGVPLGTERIRAYQVLNEAMSPKHSPTFRKGGTGGWREHFTRANLVTFQEVTGDLMERLGYPTDRVRKSEETGHG